MHVKSDGHLAEQLVLLFHDERASVTIVSNVKLLQEEVHNVDRMQQPCKDMNTLTAFEPLISSLVISFH